jgi:hypothetical protein
MAYLSPFDAISFSNNGKNCGINVGKELRIFVLFAIRNSSVRSATIGSANSLGKSGRRSSSYHQHHAGLPPQSPGRTAEWSG